MGFWKSVSKALNPKTAGQFISGSKSDSNVINQIVGGIRKTSPDMVDRKIANVTADELRKTPLGAKDPLLAKQEKDTSGSAIEPQQLRSQLRVGATIAAVVYTAGAAGGSAGGSAGAGEGAAAGSEAGSALYGASEGAAMGASDLTTASWYNAGSQMAVSAPSTSASGGSWLSGAGSAIKAAQPYLSTASTVAGLARQIDAAGSKPSGPAPARGSILLPDGRYIDAPTATERERETIIHGAGSRIDFSSLLPLLLIGGGIFYYTRKA